MRLRIADISIDVHAIHETLQRQAADYIDSADAEADVDASADLCVVITQQDIDAERGEEHHPDGYLETLAVLRKIAEAAPDFDAFLMHGATIGYRGRAYAFLALSGTGKSTHIRQWRNALGDEVEVINGDKPIVRLVAGEFIAYGTPYNGKERWGANISAPLAGVCLLERGEHDVLTRLDPTVDGGFIVNKLFQQVYMPRNPQRAAKMLELLNQLVSAVPLWRLSCTPTPAAFEAAVRMTQEA